VLIASAHWETALPMLTGSDKPETIHDFGGFPEELFKIRYPGAGSPKLAQEAVSLMKDAGITAGVNGCRGIDHGAWVPLRWMYPAADVPVVQLSLQPELGHRAPRRPRACARAARRGGRADRRLGTCDAQLARLDDQSSAPGAAALRGSVRELGIGAARRARTRGAGRLSRAGAGRRRAHPSEEHYLPLLVAWGAAGRDAQVERRSTGSKRERWRTTPTSVRHPSRTVA
jgi:4,5-DOPA dioxygenase extradiol